MIRLIVSIFFCIERNSGCIREMISPMQTMSTGTTTSSSVESLTSSRRAMKTPPTHMIGADTIIVNVSSTTIWTCWTSLVERVISVGAPKCPTSCAAKDCTFAKMPARKSRPSAMAVRAPK